MLCHCNGNPREFTFPKRAKGFWMNFTFLTVFRGGVTHYVGVFSVSRSGPETLFLAYQPRANLQVSVESGSDVTNWSLIV